MLFVTARDRFLLDCQSRALSPGTWGRYKTDLDTLGFFLSHRAVVHLEEITPDLLREFVKQLLERRHRHHKEATLSPFTVDGIYRSCKTFFAFCTRENILRLSPMEHVRHVKLPDRLTPRLSEEQVLQLIAATGKTKMPKRNLAIILLLADSGLRRSEMLNITLDDINMIEGYVRVIGKGNKQRDVPIGVMALKALQQWIKKRPASKTRRVFINANGMPFQKNGLGSLFLRLRKQLGLKRLYPHLLRHTFAKMYLLNSRDIKSLQLILGHSQSSTTLDEYIQYGIADLKKIHRRSSPVDLILKKVIK